MLNLRSIGGRPDRGRRQITEGDHLWCPAGRHYCHHPQPLVTGDLRLRVTLVPPRIDDGRDWLLLRGYVIDPDGVEAVRETWHNVRPRHCLVRAPGAGHGC